ncbi:HEPN domain-containing protein [Serratia liquefaciens]|uniref:ApeA N-terminal domain 1-containing protein n=1 Tax=Serratia liquefaciens TaxID=614 RepID=UPI0039C74D4B
MAVKTYDFTKEYSFHGEFWHDYNDNKGRFPAKIEYSPYNGLILDYCISDSDSPMSCERLYGVLNTGEPCTLIGPFDFHHSSMHLGKLRVLTGRHHFQILIFNGFHEKNEKIEHCDLALYGMQEFIHPQGFITQLKHSEKPLMTAQGADWKIDVINTATFNMIGDGLINIVNCQNDDALVKFKKDFSLTKELFPNAFFLLRNKLKFYFRYTNTVKKDVSEHIYELCKISGLFSILLDKPVIPEELHIKFSGSSEKKPCLFSNSTEQRTIDLALSDINHHLLPLNWNQVDLHLILCNWLTIGDDYDSLSVTYQNETGYRTLHQAHADIILYATQLEAINLSLSGKTSEKYTGPIDKYASTSLKDKLEKAFSNFNSDPLGKNISALRNELAHVGRPKIMMKKMKIDDYIKIGLYLKVIVTSQLLSRLGLSKEQIERYQNKVAL